MDSNLFAPGIQVRSWAEVMFCGLLHMDVLRLLNLHARLWIGYAKFVPWKRLKPHLGLDSGSIIRVSLDSLWLDISIRLVPHGSPATHGTLVVNCVLCLQVKLFTGYVTSWTWSADPSSHSNRHLHTVYTQTMLHFLVQKSVNEDNIRPPTTEKWFLIIR